MVYVLAFIAVAVMSFMAGHGIGYMRGMWGSHALIRLNLAHATSFENGKRIGYALAKSEK